jgi:putative transposase
MELATRKVIWFAVIDQADVVWVSQQARNLCWELGEVGVDARFLIHDHDAKYGGGSDLVFRAEGIEVIRTPIAAPKANAHIEPAHWFDLARVPGLDPDPQPWPSRARP